jgi:hypothetical protein
MTSVSVKITISPGNSPQNSNTSETLPSTPTSSWVITLGNPSQKNPSLIVPILSYPLLITSK